MPDFAKRELRINGVRTVVLTVGAGPPLVYFHGAGTAARFDFALDWAQRFRVVIPYHPGFGESDDNPAITTIADFVPHYVELFAALDLERVFLAGQSMGGFIAATLAAQRPTLVAKLALVCPIGVPIPEHPSADFLNTPPAELPALLAADPQWLIERLPSPPDEAFIAERIKEGNTAGRLIGERPYDPALVPELSKLTMPTMLVWGREDRLTPLEQHRTWAKLLPKAELALFANAGHLVLDESPESVAAVGDFFAR